MKSVIIKLGLFIGLFFAVDLLLGTVMGHFYHTSQNINLRDANYGFLENIKDDILIFGASELSHALISNRMAETTGLSTYNLACDACGIYYQYPLLQTILATHSPKAIVLSSNQMNEENLRYIAKLYPFYGKNGYVKRMIDELHPKEFLKLSLQGYVFNSKLIRVFDKKDNNLNGYVPLPPKESKTKYLKSEELPLGTNHPISENTESYFIKFVEKAKSKGTFVYVCIPPVLEKTNENYRNKITSRIENSGAKLIDFSKDPALVNHKELFFDRTHLNDDGAKVATDKVLEVLKADEVY